MQADWSLQVGHDELVYESLIVDACYQTGLYAQLRRGVSLEELIGDYNPRVVLPLVETLTSCNVVQCISGKLYWADGHLVETRLARAQQIRHWLQLSQCLVEENCTISPDTAIGLHALDDSIPALLEWLREVIDFAGDQRWLDIGAGTGRLGMEIASRVKEVTLCDRAEIAQTWGDVPRNVTILAQDIRHAEITGFYNGMLLCRVIETMDPQELGKLLRVLRGHLAESGAIYIIGYYAGAPLEEFFSLYLALCSPTAHRYGTQQIVDLAKGCGFGHVSTTSHETLKYHLIALQP